MSTDNPRTHAEREAAQRADEAELGYYCHACQQMKHGWKMDSCACTVAHARSWRTCPCAQCATFRAQTERDTASTPDAEGTPEGDAARWLANRGLPPMAGGAMTEAESRVYAMEQQAKRDAAMRADPHYHEGHPSVHVIGKGRKALVAVYCPAGHVYTSTPMQDWAGSWLEAKVGDKHWTVQCIGTLPEGWRGPIMGGAPTPADDPAEPGAPREAERNAESARGGLDSKEATRHLHIEHTRAEGTVVRSGAFEKDSAAHRWLLNNWSSMNHHDRKHEIVECDYPYCCDYPNQGVEEHTHPCPTCHQTRPCTGTGCADGPRECTTCSNCRGW